jgi:hypothetical protein
VILHHCSTVGQCHEHHQFTRTGVKNASFTAPDHEYPAHLEIILRATDSQGLSSEQRVRINPRTVNLNFRSSPTGLTLTVNDVAQKTPFTRTMIYASRNVLAAASPQVLNGRSYTFRSWNDGGARVHTISARDNVRTTYTATFR